MGSRFPIAALTAAALLFAQPASAGDGMWAWLSSLSPPGPFTGDRFGWPALLATACRQDGDWKLSPFGTHSADQTNRRGTTEGAQGHPILPCAYVEWVHFKSESDFKGNPDSVAGYPEIHVRQFDIGMSVRLHDALDIGGGYGRIWFRHDDEATGTEATKAKFTITPVRVVMRPLLFFVPENRWRPFAGAVSVYWKEVFVPGPIRGDDFGEKRPKGQAEFSEDATFAASVGVILDVTAFLRGFLEFKRRP